MVHLLLSTISDCLSEKGLDFLAKCFVHDPRKRWTAEMLEDHTFIKVSYCNRNYTLHEIVLVLPYKQR